MKISRISHLRLGLLIGVAGLCSFAAVPARATNSNVEVALRNYPDLSMFYQAMVNTGVTNELNQGMHYTIFAPVNSAFVQIPPDGYPCFYSAECRPQIAELLRDHILVGRHDLADLVTYGSGIQTTGVSWVHVDEPYLGNYAVDDRTILSESEVGGSIVYRIDGVLASPRQLSQFRTEPTLIPADDVVTTRTTTHKTYRVPAAADQPAGGLLPEPAGESETRTTVIESTHGPD